MSKAYRGAILTAFITTIVCIGDTILYSVLPVYAASLNLSDFLVGLFLSLNRFIRLATHGIIAAWILKFGVKKIVLLSAIAATVSSFLYKSPEMVFSFLIARVLWGMAYSGLRQSNLYYASSDQLTRNKSFALSHVVKSIGPIVILILGPSVFQRLAYEMAFVSIAMISSFGIALAFFLTEIQIDKENYSFGNVLRIDNFKFLLLSIAFLADGLIVVVLALLFSELTVSTEALLLAVSLYLLMKRLISFLLPLAMLKTYSHFSIDSHFYFGLFLVVLGLSFVSQFFYLLGIPLLFMGATIVENVAPLKALQESDSGKMEVVTSVTLWWDIGKAVGSLMGILLFKHLGENSFFLISAFILLCLLLRNLFQDNGNQTSSAL